MRKVAVPARSSVVNVVLRSLSLKCLPTLLSDINELSRVITVGRDPFGVVILILNTTTDRCLVLISIEMKYSPLLYKEIVAS